MHRHEEPKTYFYERFKGNDDYVQICFNQTYEYNTKHYEYYHKKIFKFVKRPYRYFQLFSNKEKNKKLGKGTKFFCENEPIKVINIAHNIYYEGMEFNNYVFDSVEIEKVCFHNCSFFNCRFQNITSKTSQFEKSPAQGFSSCDFYKCVFERCNLRNIFFSVGNIDYTVFSDVSLSNCIFQRISFNKVTFTGKTTLNNTYIYSSSKNFDISFDGPIDDVHVDAKCHVTAFSYFDRANYTIERWMDNKKYKLINYNKIADTYYILDQIFKSNCIREESDSYSNLYFQRKKAETRNKKGVSKILGYLSEWTTGYGEKPYNAIFSMACIIVFFALIYMFTGFWVKVDDCIIKYNIFKLSNLNWKKFLLDFFQSIYFSFFTMITVGQGGAGPASSVSQLAISIELLIGAIIMTLFTGTLFRKLTK